ncbi:MAG: DNA translocase FtsK 4TM domain-containing protein [Deltaproteobacteria bacterium]|nr:DNA translocase FtsK 4TM domain-containing protein [Deltaproteobacteria bacterium]
MERMSFIFGRIAPALALAAALLAAQLTFSYLDPTVSNLRLPSQGVRNLLGPPGALVGGTLVEWLGGWSLALPVLLALWAVTPRHRLRLPLWMIHAAVFMSSLSVLHTLAGGAPGPGLHAAGLAGWIGRRWVEMTLGIVPGAALLLVLVGISFSHLVSPGVILATAREAWVFLAFALRRVRGHRLASGQDVTLGGGWISRWMTVLAGDRSRRLGSSLANFRFGLSHPLRALRIWRESRRLRGGRPREKGQGMKAPQGAGQPPLTDPTLANRAAQEAPSQTPPQTPSHTLARAQPPVSPGGFPSAGASATATPKAASASPVAGTPSGPRAPSQAGGPSEPGRRLVETPGGSPPDPQAPGPVASTITATEGSGEMPSPAPEEEAAWRQRFQRYVREARLEYQARPWRESGSEEDEDDHPPERGTRN